MRRLKKEGEEKVQNIPQIHQMTVMVLVAVVAVVLGLRFFSLIAALINNSTGQRPDGTLSLEQKFY